MLPDARISFAIAGVQRLVGRQPADLALTGDPIEQAGKGLQGG